MTPTTAILAIDQGTTNTKALLITPDGNCIGQASRPVDIRFPRAGWVEQDPRAVWQSVVDAVQECLESTSHPPLAAVAISNQRESAVAWDRKTGQPLAPLVSWQCRRSADFCASLRDVDNEKLVYDRTGLALDPMFTASKFRWLLDNIPDGHQRAENAELCLGTVDSWLVWNFTGGAVHRTDVTNASRTQLFNLHHLTWDGDLLNLFGIPHQALPEVLESSANYGETVTLGSLPGGIPVASVIGDSHAALFGHAGFAPGSVKATFGTGSSLMTPTAVPRTSPNGLSTTVAWGYSGVTYALEGNIYVTGAAVQWLGDFLGIKPADVAARATEVDDTGGAYFVPAFVGLGAPYWVSDARGLLTGLTRGSGSAHVARAVVESIAYQIRDIFDLMESDSGSALNVLLADGGPTRNDMLMQFQADIIGRPVVRNNSTNLSALGAAYLAGLALGTWTGYEDIARLPRSTDRFEPVMPDAKRESLYSGWRDAVSRALFKS